ncbi:S-4TM family putative pore-forming effector [Saccharibacillus sacchari]|uniref:S-4TM family putative pore-forming effector n=1 Tax=Saccharibacillus sacchari TaxID=456493 RepID=UPI0004AD249B|nr:S-4TM family putative pore-forming effector [Saccharibacillus sacchari]
MTTADNGIATRQNSERNIKILAAQRQLYKEAKVVSHYQFAACVLLPILIVFVKPLIPSNTSILAIITLLSILIIISNSFIFEKVVKSKKEKAARFQETFDTMVLDLSWNSALCGPRNQAVHDLDQIFNKYLKKNKSLNTLKDWYPQEYSKVEIFAGRIMCQQVNTVWDGKLRDYFQNFLKILFIFCVLIVLIIGLLKNDSVVNTFVSIAAPLAPICIYTYKQYTDNKATISRSTKLSYDAENLWVKLLSNIQDPELSESSRKLQNDIYKYRESALMIWDWFYWVFRNKQECNMNSSAEIVVEDYRNSRNS